MTFVDPQSTEVRRLPNRLDPSEILSNDLEVATDAYAVACNEAAIAENAYLKHYAEVFLHADVAATIRPKTAECEAVDQRGEWNIKTAVEKSAKAKVEELKHRLMAALSHAKVVAGQT